MKIEVHNGDRERRVLSGMITNETVLGRISAKWHSELFQSKWANIISRWCVDFHKEYKQAPNKVIENLFSSWSEKTQDDSQVKIINQFLATLSEEYEQSEAINPNVLIDEAGKYFHKVQVQRLKDRLEVELSNGDLEKADDWINKYARIEMGVGAGVDLFTDFEAMSSTYSQSIHDPLVEYPGALGEIRNEILRNMDVKDRGFYAFIIIGIAAMIGLFSPGVAILFGAVGYIIASSFGFINMTGTSLALLAGILLSIIYVGWKMRT